MTKRVIRIEGMTCGHCVNWITQALMRVRGVTEAKADLENQRAYVTYDETAASDEMIADAIEKAGYEAAEIKKVV